MANRSVAGVVFLLVLALGSVASGAAQGAGDTPSTALTEDQRALEQELRSELVCVCGTCPHLTLATCTCPDADHMRDQLAAQVALGKDRQGIFQFFIDTYGSQEPLGAPIGAFNQLAWLFPFAAGGVALVLVGGIAARWSGRKSEESEAPGSPGFADAELNARLDEELRNLD